MKRKAYESSGVPISFTHEQYRDGKRDYVLIRDQFKEGNLKDVMEFVASDLPQTKLQGYIKELDFIPTRNVILPVDSAKVIANGTVKPQDADQIVKDLRLHLPMQGLTKSQLMVLDILSTNNWERPVYWVRMPIWDWKNTSSSKGRPTASYLSKRKKPNSMITDGSTAISSTIIS